MNRRTHTPERIVRMLREADRLRGEGKTIPEAAKAIEISEQTFDRSRNPVRGAFRRPRGRRASGPR